MTRLLVTIGFLIAFAAGLVVSPELRHKTQAVPTSRPSRHTGWLTTELNLTPQQQEQLREIWSQPPPDSGRQRGEDRKWQYLRERNDAIAGLIRPEDKPRYEAIIKDFEAKNEVLEREMRAGFQAAVDRTKQILTPEQRAKYEELLQRHDADRSRRDWRRPDRERGPGPGKNERSTSGPAR